MWHAGVHQAAVLSYVGLRAILVAASLALDVLL